MSFENNLTHSNSKVALKGLIFLYFLVDIYIRSVYGITVKHHSMWAKDDNGGNRTESCAWTYPDGCGFLCDWIKRHIV